MEGRLLEGKLALVAGVANRRSIAWAIAERLAAQGASLAFTYQGERLRETVSDLAASVGSTLVVECDVASDESLDRAFAQVSDGLGGLDLLVHSIAFAKAHDLSALDEPVPAINPVRPAASLHEQSTGTARRPPT